MATAVQQPAVHVSSATLGVVGVGADGTTGVAASVDAVTATPLAAPAIAVPAPAPGQRAPGSFTFMVRVCDTGHTEALTVRRGCLVKDVKDMLSQRLAVASAVQVRRDRGGGACAVTPAHTH